MRRDGFLGLLPQPLRGHPEHESRETPSCHSSIGSYSDCEGAVLLLCRFLAHREMFAAEIIGRTLLIGIGH